MPRPDTKRCVWLDESLVTYLRDIVSLMGPEFFRDRVRSEIIAAYDAAPVDPAEAVKLALIECDGYDEDAVLAALGYESGDAS